MTVDELMAEMKSYLDLIEDKADEGFDTLESMASLPFQTWISFAKDPTLELIGSDGLISSEDLPTLNLEGLDFSTLPDLNPTLYKENVWEGEFFEFVSPILEDQILNGGPGISQAVQDAIFNQTRERDIQTLNDSLEATRSAFGKRGFPLPNDMLLAQEQAVITRFEDTQSQRNREITALIAERAQQNMQSAINSGITIEQAKMNFAANFARLFQDMITAMISRTKAQIEAEVARYEGEMRGILAQLEVLKMNTEISDKHQDRLLRKWEVETRDNTDRTRVLIDQAKIQSDFRLTAAEALAKFYATMMASVAGQLTGITIKEESDDSSN